MDSIKYFNMTTNCLNHFINSYKSEIFLTSFLILDSYFFKMESFFNLQDSSIYLNNITLKNSYFNDSITFICIWKLFKSLYNEGNSIILKDSYFYNISSIGNVEFDLIFLNISSLDFKLINCIFKNISCLGKIINIENYSNSLLMTNNNFVNNNVKYNIYVQSCQYFLLANTTCKNNNILVQTQTYGEACFFVKNTFYRELQKIVIVNAFSKLTVAGILFWDEDFFAKQYFQNIVIMIADSNFMKIKALFPEYTRFEGAAINIISKSNLFVINCKFLSNEVEIKNSVTFSIGGPCITSYWNNIAFIINSYFKNNRSIKLSNCLIIYSKSLFVINHIFITILFLVLQMKCLKASENYDGDLTL